VSADDNGEGEGGEVEEEDAVAREEAGWEMARTVCP